MKWYIQGLKKYADFSGRASRKEFWMFSLFNFIFTIVAIILDNLLGTTIEGMGYGLFLILYGLVVTIPGVAVAVRRLHDVGKSGWIILIILIPLIGPIWFFVLLVTESHPKEYRPKLKKEYRPKLKEDTEEKDNFYNVIMSFLISVFISCASYAFLSETKIIDCFQKADTIKNLIFIVFFVALFIFSLTISLTNKNKNRIPKQDN